MGRWLSDPVRWWTQIWRWVGVELAVYGPVLASTGAAAAVCAALTAAMVRHARRARWAADARWVEVIPAHMVDPHGAQRLWAALYGLRRDRLTRWRRGQEHLSFEMLADADGIRFGFWVAGCSNLGFVQRQIRAAWPGAQVRVHTSPPTPIPTASEPQR